VIPEVGVEFVAENAIGIAADFAINELTAPLIERVLSKNSGRVIPTPPAS